MDDIDLQQIINKTAFKQLLDIQIPSNINVHSISLIPNHPNTNQTSYNNNNDMNKDSNNQYNIMHDSDDDNTIIDSKHQKQQSSWDHTTFNSGVTTKNSEDIFILANKNMKLNADIIPLSKILGDNFDENPSNKLKKKKSKHKDIEINTTEMIPSGDYYIL